MTTSALLTRYRRRIASVPRSFVVQWTQFCQLHCDYCYLPDKDKKTAMPLAVASAVADSIRKMAAHYAGDPLTLIWHAGEPLALGRARFAEVLDVFEDLRAQGLVRHSLQTNATLINDAWVDLFARYDIQIGVSLDGPAELNRHRVDRHGRPAFDRIMRGIGRLQARGVPFSVISVVTAGAAGRAHELLDFLASLGPTSIGLSIEELEGVNTTAGTPSLGQARAFWQDVLGWVRARGAEAVPVRETDRLGRYLALTPEERRTRRAQYRIDPLPTIAVNGDVVILSPELAGISSQTYDDFRAGNVLEQDIPSILDRGHELRYVQEFLDSLDGCEAECAFYDFCLGSQAGNRFFEHGSFMPSETEYCRVTEQAPVEALAAIVEKEKAA